MEERFLTWKLYRKFDQALVWESVWITRSPFDAPTHFLNGEEGYWELWDHGLALARIPVNEDLTKSVRTPEEPKA